MNNYKPDNPMAAIAFIEKYKVSLSYVAGEWRAVFSCYECERVGLDGIFDAYGEDIATALEGLYSTLTEEGIIEED